VRWRLSKRPESTTRCSCSDTSACCKPQLETGDTGELVQQGHSYHLPLTPTLIRTCCSKWNSSSFKPGRATQASDSGGWNSRLGIKPRVTNPRCQARPRPLARSERSVRERIPGKGALCPPSRLPRPPRPLRPRLLSRQCPAHARHPGHLKPGLNWLFNRTLLYN